MAAALDSKIYVIGGRFEGGFQAEKSDAVEVFDPKTDTWSSRARMLRPRGGLNGIEALGCIHVWGGEGNKEHPSAWRHRRRVHERAHLCTGWRRCSGRRQRRHAPSGLPAQDELSVTSSLMEKGASLPRRRSPEPRP